LCVGGADGPAASGEVDDVAGIAFGLAGDASVDEDLADAEASAIAEASEGGGDAALIGDDAVALLGAEVKGRGEEEVEVIFG
jgi:hypothetical protein